MKTEEFIRSRARMNWSRRMVADALGMDYQKFRTVVAPSLPDVKWCKPNESVDRRRSYEERAGVSTPTLRRSAAIAREVRYSQAVKHNVGGFVGTTKEVFDHWETFASVTYSQVRRRLKRGVNILDALFKPNETHLGWGQNAHIFKNHSDYVFGRVSGALR